MELGISEECCCEAGSILIWVVLFIISCDSAVLAVV